RAMYFLLADLMDRFVHLKLGLALVLVWVGVKMLLLDVVHIPTLVSLGVVIAILAVAVITSLRATRTPAAVEAVAGPTRPVAPAGATEPDATHGRTSPDRTSTTTTGAQTMTTIPARPVSDDVVALTVEGRNLLEERVAMIRDVSLPVLRPLLAAHDRDERDVAEFERLVEEQGRLEALLATSTALPDEHDQHDGVVRPGTRLLIEMPDGEQVWIRPVHPAEAFLDDERVSVVSPVSRAVLGARAGDVVAVAGPAGSWDCRVVEVPSARDPRIV
ncbi:MAG TPA: GreA/GreB family elongation factor, partial [Candidatus Nanopelagicales bacterium]|nr:GreA/GreB family elongation factor [Candidatus Nanopelagicales bacterium]